jgi:hypothetical protein
VPLGNLFHDSYQLVVCSILAPQAWSEPTIARGGPGGPVLRQRRIIHVICDVCMGAFDGVISSPLSNGNDSDRYSNLTVSASRNWV